MRILCEKCCVAIWA